MARILILEDDAEYRAWLLRALNPEHSCSEAGSIRQAWIALNEGGQPFDLLLVDESLPDGRGTEFCAAVRKSPQRHTLIAMLSGNRKLVNGSLWLSAGADTCWLKMHQAARILSLVGGLLRRRVWDTQGFQSPIPGLSLNRSYRTISFERMTSGQLSSREMDFITLLLDRHPNTVTRAEIREHVFSGSIAEQIDLAINEFVRRLRRKLPGIVAEGLEAVHGRGYRLSLS